jgi:predicted nucleotidyltransferase
MHENLIRIKAIAQILKGLEQPYVFVGGATVSLYATKAVAENIRPTDDVDVVIELASYADHSQLEERLRALGVANDVESGVICRYKIEGIIVDIMPTNPSILGFSNSWYPDGFNNAIPYQLDAETEVHIFSLPYFLASKWEAHQSRGSSDLRTSRDFEDMVYVFENCKDFDDQLLAGPASVKEYLTKELLEYLDHPDFEEALYCHMESARYGANPQGLINKIKMGLGL